MHRNVQCSISHTAIGGLVGAMVSAGCPKARFSRNGAWDSLIGALCGVPIGVCLWLLLRAASPSQCQRVGVVMSSQCKPPDTSRDMSTGYNNELITATAGCLLS